MGKFSSKDCVFLIDGHDVLGSITEIGLSEEAITEDATAMGDDWEEHSFSGIRKLEISQDGFYDAASHAINDALNEHQGQARILCLGFQGNATGQAFVGSDGPLQVNYTRVASRGTLHRARADYHGETTEEGRILHPLRLVEDATGNTEDDPVEESATTNGASAYLHVTALDLDGYDGLSITILENDGNGWELLDTFATVEEADVPHVERLEIEGAIEKDLAIAWDLLGSGTNPTAKFFVGLARH